MKKTGSIQGKQSGDYRVARLDAFREDLKIHLASKPSLTLKEIQIWLEREYQKSLSISAIDKFIRHKLGYHYKKWCTPVNKTEKRLRKPEPNRRLGKKAS